MTRRPLLSTSVRSASPAIASPRSASPAIATAMLLASILSPALARARGEMTRLQITDLAWPAMGHGYKWGGTTWTADGSKKGWCVDQPGPSGEEGCPTCSFPANKVGADCSGYITKAWQIPQPFPIDEERTDNPHPYNAGWFYGNTTEWGRISFNDLKAGDAIACSHHIVMFIAKESGNYRVWEAKGCLHGIKESLMNFDVRAGDTSTADGLDSRGDTVTWRALRRLDLVEQVTCPLLNYCNGHGACAEASGQCTCSPGFRTPRDPDRLREACTECAEGYFGYPRCQRVGSTCSLSGYLGCEGTAYTLNPMTDGTASLADYGGECTGSGAEGPELVYHFAPVGIGRAKLKLTGGGSLRVLRSACTAAACVAEGTGSVSFEYGGGEVFFVVVESNGSSSDLQLRLECEDDIGEWIGDPCESDTDCDDMLKPPNPSLSSSTDQELGTPLAGGYCYRSQGADAPGFCSFPCSKSKDCPNRVERAPTFCIAAPEDSAKGMCVSKSVAQNQHCGTVPGTAANSRPRFGYSHQATVCYPGGSAACQAEIHGVIVDYSSGVPVPNARVEISGPGLSTPVQLPLDAGGNYREAGFTCGDYTLSVSADGYLPEAVTVKVNGSGRTEVTPLRALAEGACELSDLTGTVFDGTSADRSQIPGATVSLYRGLDTREGEAVASALTDDAGVFSFTALQPGNYTAMTLVDGFASHSTNVVACSEPEETSPATDIAVLPSVPGAMRIILEWERPDDLDLHLQLPNGEEVHFYDPCRSLGGATLEVDRLTPDGPEAIVVDRFTPGLYTVFVHNYSAQRDGDDGFEVSNARVVVQGPDGEELGRFYVPTGGGAFFWDVFSFQGSEPQTLHPLQYMNSIRLNPYNEYTEDCRP